MNRSVIHGEGLGKLIDRGMQSDSGLRHSLERFVRSPFSASAAPAKKSSGL